MSFNRILNWRGRWTSRLAGPLLAAAAGGLVFLIDACSSVDQSAAVSPPVVAGATFVGDKTCADCHANITRAFPQSAHARLHLAGTGRELSTGCESCHGPASKHVAAGRGGPDFIINPGKDPSACFQCHADIESDFHLPQHHPVLEGKMNCVQCHDPHGLDILKPAGGLALSRENETCAQCHREQTRPFVFEHAAMREGCVTCHEPHGSINPKLLTVRDDNLCLRCHAETQGPSATRGGIFIGNVNHLTFLRYGSCWTAGCHTAVHGSDTQPFFFY